jgi:Zn-finger nucleic acid-binding protein
MQCSTHGTVLPTNGHDETEITCPECREIWLTRGDLYQLPPRDPGDEQPPGSDWDTP